jgi:two-component system, OmpR family, alkaline phosphatase synthesis response regulator PhoP
MAASKILIADDNLPNVELLEAYLAEMDCAIAVATDGRETLDKVIEFQPDLILLDIMMPKLSGFEVCKQLKKNQATKQIMILMVTALDEPGDIERAVSCGCDDFLSKPINKLELLKRVEVLLRLRHVTDELERLRRYIDEMEEREKRGGRWPVMDTSWPVCSGYRPQVFYDGDDWDAEQSYPGIQQVHPGDTVTAQLTFTRPHLHLGRVRAGMEFLIREGARTGGRGRGTKILDLECNTARIRDPESKAIIAKDRWPVADCDHLGRHASSQS